MAHQDNDARMWRPAATRRFALVVLLVAACASVEEDLGGVGDNCDDRGCEEGLVCVADCSAGTCGPQTCEEQSGEGEGEGEGTACVADDDCGTQVCVEGVCEFDDLGDACFSDLQCNYDVCFTPEPTGADPNPDAFCSKPCETDLDCPAFWSCVDDAEHGAGAEACIED